MYSETAEITKQSWETIGAKCVSRSAAIRRISGSLGAHFWVKFMKKDGSTRTLAGEIRPPKAQPKNPSPAFYNPDLILVGDLEVYYRLLSEGQTGTKAYDGSYRCITKSQLMEFIIDNQFYIVESDDDEAK